MATIIFLIHIFLFFIISLTGGMSGMSTMKYITERPIVALYIVILLLGIFSTAVWGWKSARKENYKIWFYISIGSILLFLLIQIVPNWQVFLRGLHF
jgi:hypothetical protein